MNATISQRSFSLTGKDLERVAGIPGEKYKEVDIGGEGLEPLYRYKISDDTFLYEVFDHGLHITLIEL